MSGSFSADSSKLAQEEGNLDPENTLLEYHQNVDTQKKTLV